MIACPGNIHLARLMAHLGVSDVPAASLSRSSSCFSTSSWAQLWRGFPLVLAESTHTPNLG